MATTTRRQQVMPLLRRPLPPKPIPSPPKSPSPSPLRNQDNRPESLLKTSDLSSQSRTKPTHFLERDYSGDVPLPNTSVVLPYRPRGPAPLPARQPRRVRELPDVSFDSYERPSPAFTLKNFVLRVPSRVNKEEREIMVSDQNYEKLTSWFAANRPKQSNIHSLDIDSLVDVPDVSPRIPPCQLSIEMRVPVAEMENADIPAGPGFRVYPDKAAKLSPITPAVSKQTTPTRHKCLPPIDQRTTHGNEPIKYEKIEQEPDDLDIKKQTIHKEPEVTKSPRQFEDQIIGTDNEELFGRTSGNNNQQIKTKKLRINFSEDLEEGVYVKQSEQDSEESLNLDRPSLQERDQALSLERIPKVAHLPESDIVLPSSAPAFFQGGAIPRTSSPFMSMEEYHTQVSPLEAVILNTLMTHAATLNIKAHFLSKMPTMIQLSEQITHLNASFNDFWVFPPEILDLRLLVSLKLRNNPIKEIPHGISVLEHLRILDMSFNLVNSIPSCLFELTNLDHLDLSYNRISFVPSEIGNLRNLRELSLEGNQIGALPANILFLRLKHFRISNNFIHQLFWKETASNQPQRLVDLCALVVNTTNQDSLKMALLPDSIKSFLKRCDCCGGILFGQGVRVIKPIDIVFKVRNLPLLFSSCSQKCRRKFIKDEDAIQLWLLRNDTFADKKQ